MCPVSKGTKPTGQGRSSTLSLDVQERAQDDFPAQNQAPKLHFPRWFLNTHLLFKFVSACLLLSGESRKNKRLITTASPVARTSIRSALPVSEFAVLNFLSLFLHPKAERMLGFRAYFPSAVASACREQSMS